MLNGKELGAAIRQALADNGKTPADAARHFKVKPPSVSGWLSTGRISKDKFTRLVAWLDKTPLSHWGLGDYAQVFAGTSYAPPVVGTRLAKVMEPQATYGLITVDAAMARIAQHLESVDGYNPATAISLFSTLANDPSMHEIVAAGLKTLKPEARAPAKRDEPAQEAGTSRAA